MSHSHFNIIIVGTGLAGYTLARELRKRSPDTSLLMVTRDDGAYYSKPMLSNGLAKNKSADDLATKTSGEMAETLEATIRTHTTVVTIDTDAHSISTESESFEYDNLVLACGAQQIKLPITGSGASDILTVNDLGDYAIFRQKLQSVKRVAVMGPGLIGCEFANDLSNVGITTIIIGPDLRPLERLMPEEPSMALKNAMNAFDVEWYLETVVSNVDRDGAEYVLELSSGESVRAGLVLSAAGLKPDLTLANCAGLATNIGIVVDRAMRTSDPHVYALGDCIEIESMLLPYVMPIMHASRALSKTLSGETTDVVYPAMPVAIKTPVHPIVVATPPPGVVGEWTTESVEGGVKSMFHTGDGELQGFVLTGDKVKEKMKLERRLPKLIA